MPFAATDIDFLGVADRLAASETSIPVASLIFGPVSAALDFAVVRLINRSPRFDTFFLVTGLVDRTTHLMADVFVDSIVHRFADLYALFLIVRPIDRAAGGHALFSIACFVNRTTDRVRLVTVTGLIHIPRDGVGNLLVARVEDCLLTRIGLSFPDGFLDGFVSRAAAASLLVVTAGHRLLGIGTAGVARCSAISGFD